jgi:hypothetical protein
LFPNLSQGSLKLLLMLGVARKKKERKKRKEWFRVPERNLGGEDEAKGDQAK